MKYIASLLLLLLIFSCNDTNSYVSIAGKTMGTTYHITHSGDVPKAFDEDIEMLLKEINAEVNTYDPNSLISKVNQQAINYNFKAEEKRNHFLANMKAAAKVNQDSDGYFDPSVMPLVNYWGFGTSEKKAVERVDSLAIEAMLEHVGFHAVKCDDAGLVKKHEQMQLDFSAIAKGYAVDKVADLLASNGIKNYLVEIGGEVVAKGVNTEGENWRLAINRPLRNAAVGDIQLVLPLKDKALATSGNYRNYYQADGFTYAHTINPKTGFPEQSSLLSASVVAKECMFADAYATAFMTLGLEKSQELVESLNDVEAIFIYNDGKGGLAEVASSGLQYILEKQ